MATKQVMVYNFNPAARTIEFFDYDGLKLEQIMGIINDPKGIPIYNPMNAALGGTMNGDVLTLVYDTSAQDPLTIKVYVELDPDDTIPTPVLPGVVGQQPVSVSFPVALANEHVFDLNPAPSITYAPVINTILVQQDCLQYRSVALQISAGAGISAGALSFECCNTLDSGFWISMPLLDETATTNAAATAYTLAASTNRFFRGPIEFRYFRVRVSTAVAGGPVEISATFRMTPFSMPLITAVPSNNISQVGGNATASAGIIGTMPAAGPTAVGVVSAAYPVPIGSVDYNNYVRKILSDAMGHLVIAGSDPTKRAEPVAVRLVDSAPGKMHVSEILELILNELRAQNYFLKELPLVLSTPGGSFQETSFDFIEALRGTN